MLDSTGKLLRWRQSFSEFKSYVIHSASIKHQVAYAISLVKTLRTDPVPMHVSIPVLGLNPSP